MKTQKGKLFYTLMALGIVPLLIYGIIILIFGNFTVSKSLAAEAESGMKDVAGLAVHMMDLHYPGDFRIEGDVALRLYKGDHDITSEYHLVDFIKEETGLEASLFYQDTRILTTILDWDGNRIIGSGAPEIVLEDVLATGESKFYENVIINGEPYFAYYTPLFHSNGEVTGMLFVGKPVSSIQSMIRQSLYPLTLAGIIALVASALITFRYSRNVSEAVVILKQYFAQISDGNLNAKLDEKVKKRQDELSEIGQSAAGMQHALRKLIERDALTDLYNRRSGEKKLQATYEQSLTDNLDFTVVLCDIDYFKKVNDTYGHESGDTVLKNVALLLREKLHGKGYAVRWGGEEFLLVYEKMDLATAKDYLTILNHRLSQLVHHVTGDEIYVTMTYGMACDSTKNPEELLKIADDKLYMGKNNGRNQIVT